MSDNTNTPEQQEWADRYAAAMAQANELYAPELAALRATGFPDAFVTQTGGMCLAIEVPLAGVDNFPLIHVGDLEGELAWDRARDYGFAAYFYADEDDEGSTEGETRVRRAERGTPAEIVRVVAELAAANGFTPNPAELSRSGA